VTSSSWAIPVRRIAYGDGAHRERRLINGSGRSGHLRHQPGNGRTHSFDEPGCRVADELTQRNSQWLGHQCMAIYDDPFWRDADCPDS